jgi:hypothetical protein
MISETYFAQNFTSAWRLLAPALDIFVRKINLGLYTREFTPMVSTIAASRRAFVNEVAFGIFVQQMSFGDLAEDVVVKAISEARALISKLEAVDAEAIADLDSAELNDCHEQVFRLRRFFNGISRGGPLESRPIFSGCGIIETCEGDVFYDGALFEVKAGSRSFRSVDLKQLLVYSALNKAVGARALSRLGLFNPRMGISFQHSLEDVCQEVSGRSSIDLLDEIIRVVSAGDLSR